MEQAFEDLNKVLFELDHTLTPQNFSAEESVVGFLLAHPERAGELLPRLASADFERGYCRIIWMLAEVLHRLGEPVTPHNLYNLVGRIRLGDHFDQGTGGIAYMMELLQNAPHEASIAYYLAVVPHTAYRRKVVRMMENIRDLASKPQGDNRQLNKKITAVLQYILHQDTPEPPPEKPPRLSFSAAGFAAHAGSSPEWLVNDLILKGGLNLLAGEVGSGKTFLALDLAIAIASGGVPWRREASPISGRREASPISGRREASPISGRREASPISGRREASPISGRREASPISWRREASPILGRVADPVCHPERSEGSRDQREPYDCAATCSKSSTTWMNTQHPCEVLEKGGKCKEWNQAPQMNVLYLCLDTSRHTLQRRLAALCLGRGIDPPEGLHFDLSPLDLSQPKSLDTLRSLVKEHNAGLVILDALARYLPGIDENTVASISPVLTGLRSLVTSDGTTILLLHHLNKGSGYAANAPSALRIRGSSDILAAVDTALVCTGGSGGASAHLNRRLIPVKNREQPESPPCSFSLLPLDGGGLRISFADPSAAPNLVYASPPATVLERIFDILQQHPGQHFTRREIELRMLAEGIPAGSRTLDRAFAILRRRPDIQAEREGTTLKYTWKKPPSLSTP